MGGSPAETPIWVRRICGRSASSIRPTELTRALRTLERDGFVSRDQVGRVAGYELTPLGRSLLGPLAVGYDWTAEHWDEILDARDPIGA